jgi:MFS family permease
MHCIGQVYAFSVFNLPMTKLIGIGQSAPNDWSIPELGWIFSIGIFVLGFSAAIFGRWVEEGGPRRAMFAAALCWAGGFLISAIGVYVHNLWVVYFGYGLVGGCGLGIGYISPVSTLIKWCPDRPGMATGMAIMGFGGGAFIASPLSVWLMSRFSTATHVGVAETFIVMGAIYFVFMLVGAFIVRIPAPRWRPEGYTPPVVEQKLITRSDVYVYDALKTPQFWCIWVVLCVNVTAGIGVLSQASAMSQEMFPGEVSAVAAAGFVGLMSLFNMGGRFFWASTSDYIGRKNTYFVFTVHHGRALCDRLYRQSAGEGGGQAIPHGPRWRDGPRPQCRTPRVLAAQRCGRAERRWRRSETKSRRGDTGLRPAKQARSSNLKSVPALSRFQDLAAISTSIWSRLSGPGAAHDASSLFDPEPALELSWTLRPWASWLLRTCRSPDRIG